MTVIVYARPWNKEQFVDLASKTWPEKKLILSSEHPSVDQSGLYNNFYRAMKCFDKVQHGSKLTKNQVDDIVIRCRLLRAVDESLAVKLLLSMEYAIEHVLDSYSPEYMISITVDSYILHLFVLACERRGIKFVGLVPTFVNGYFRVTTVGERVHTRTVSSAECDSVLERLTSLDYKPNFVAVDKKSQNRKVFNLWCRNLIKPVWFYLKRRICKDFYNYHYLSSQLTASSYWSLYPKSYKGLSLIDESELLSFNPSKKKIFFPLQMSPEATIDYWSSDKTWINYERKVIDLVKVLSDKYCVIVKEHPNVVGYRTKGFYKELQSLYASGKCILISPEVNSNVLLRYADAVLLCTGSIGFEAAIRGIPVYTDSKPFHLPDDVCNPISLLVDGGVKEKAELSHEQKNKLLEYLLRGMGSGVFINDGSWKEGVNSQNDIAFVLKDYYELS